MTAEPDADEPPIVEEDFGGGDGRYVIRLADGSEAEMTWRWAGPNVVSIDHTFTPPALRGGGMAMRMMLRAIADARAKGLKIIPACAYVEAEFRRHKDWADVLAR